MLEKLKKSSLGRMLKRIAKRKVLGWPVRQAVRISHWEVLEAGHLKPAHMAHNARQARVVSDFRAATRNGGP